jgi:hypothetical protein
MKDVPGHMMKFMRKMAKEAKEAKQTSEDTSYKKEYRKEIISKKNPQAHKKAKAQMKKERIEHIPQDLTPEEKNKMMEKRVPRMRPRSHKTQIHITKK